MAQPTEETFNEKRIIICEGDSDSRFLGALFVRRGINGFQIIKHADGKNGFENRLRNIRLNGDFEKIETIVLVRDNDDNPKSSFDNLKQHIQKAGNYPVPSEPLKIVKSKNHLGIVIVMLPWADREGGLETLILESISAKESSVWLCLQEYLACTPAQSWNANKQSKMLLACMLAATCEGNPVGSLSYMWNGENNLKGLLDHECFKQLADFFASLPG